MGCVNCFDDCNDELTSDKCVKYTGDDVELLSICKGDSLRNIEDEIIAELVKHKTGEGITIPDISGCNSILTLLDTDPPSLKSIIQALVTSYCSLKSAITIIQSGSTVFSFDKKCLLTLTSTSSRDQVIQAVINKLCSLDTSVTNILNDYVKASDFTTLVSNYLNSINTTTVVNYYTKLIPYVAYEYYGPLSNFDSSGKGIASVGFDKVYICNGSYGTPDKRGRTAIGATIGVPGGALDSAVDPTINPGYQPALKDKIGSVNTILTIQQLPSHSHTLTDPGHSHSIYYAGDAKEGGEGNHMRTTASAFPLSTDVKQTGITIGSTGNSQPHSNIQPGIVCNFIMFIP